MGLAQLAAFLDDRFLDGVIRASGFVSRVTASIIEYIDVGLIDGLVRIIGQGIRIVGRRVRDLQSGILSDYLWNAFVTVLLLIAFLILFQRL